MIVSLGNLKRRHVYDVKLGGRKVERLMYNGHQIWPDPKRLVARITLDPDGFLGKKDYAIWRAAREVYLHREKDAKRFFMYLKDPIDGYTYVFNENVEVPDGVVVRYYYVPGGADQIDFFYSDRKPPKELLQVGDSLRIRVFADALAYNERPFSGWTNSVCAFSFWGWEKFDTGEFSGQHAVGPEKTMYWDVPPSEYAVLCTKFNKPSKKVRAEGYFHAYGAPSNGEVASCGYNIGGKKTCGFSHYNSNMKYVAGDKTVRVHGISTGQGHCTMSAHLDIAPMDLTVMVKVGKIETMDVYE